MQIGVSNFSTTHLETLLKSAKVVPAVNQVECHPLLPQSKLLEYCKSKGIVVAAYSPLGSTGSPLMQEPTVVNLAKKYSVEPGTILISFLVARGIAGERLFSLPLFVPTEKNPSLLTLTPVYLPHLLFSIFSFILTTPALPKSVTPARIQQNLKIVKLSQEDVEALATFAKKEGKLNRFVSPDWNFDLKWDEDAE